MCDWGISWYIVGYIIIIITPLCFIQEFYYAIQWGELQGYKYVAIALIFLPWKLYGHTLLWLAGVEFIVWRGSHAYNYPIVMF